MIKKKRSPQSIPETTVKKTLLVDEFQVLRRGFSIPARLYFVGNLLTFGQGRQTRTLNSRDMNKGVLRAVFRLDEAIAFGGVEELYGTNSHYFSLSIVNKDESARAAKDP